MISFRYIPLFVTILQRSLEMKCVIYDVNLSLNRLLRAEVKEGIQKNRKKKANADCKRLKFFQLIQTYQL
jgi:hypothetical protein